MIQSPFWILDYLPLPELNDTHNGMSSPPQHGSIYGQWRLHYSSPINSLVQSYSATHQLRDLIFGPLCGIYGHLGNGFNIWDALGHLPILLGTPSNTYWDIF